MENLLLVLIPVNQICTGVGDYRDELSVFDAVRDSLKESYSVGGASPMKSGFRCAQFAPPRYIMMTFQQAIWEFESVSSVYPTTSEFLHSFCEDKRIKKEAKE